MRPRWLGSSCKRQGRDGEVYTTPEDAKLGYLMAATAVAIISVVAAILAVVQ